MRSRLPTSPFIYPIVDLSVLGDRDVGAVVAELGRGGARMVQLRAKLADDRGLFEAAQAGLVAARAAGMLFIVNDRPDVARLVGADGVHLGQEDMKPVLARGLLGPEAIIGYSTHNLEQLDRSAREPIDYLAVGPVYSTRTKARPDPVVGLEMVRTARARVDRPLVAIGGITLERVREVVEAGANGIAVVSALLQTSVLEDAMRALDLELRGS